MRILWLYQVLLLLLERWSIWNCPYGKYGHTYQKKAPPNQSISITIYNATTEVASAVITAVATTVVSFLPVFTMVAAEGKLFRPLAFY